jgi:uncharacterized protein (DUF362 family)
MLDDKNFDQDNWNPLGSLVAPGNTVFIKPNMISETSTESDDWDHVITHGSVIRAIVDYVYIALDGEGKIIIGDAPQTDSSFERIIELMGLKELQELYEKHKQFKIEVVDLRDEYWIRKDDVFVDVVKLPGDPKGSSAADLADDSMFTEVDHEDRRYYGAYYDADETNFHHRAGKHEYLLSNSPLMADVFINVPKLKTHKKTGITTSLKNLVGVNANKNWLPHYTFGSPATGGDQFAKQTVTNQIENRLMTNIKDRLAKNNRLFQVLVRKSKKIGYRIFGSNSNVIRSGNWYGNDTIWRMCLDLNRILLYFTFGTHPAGLGRTPKKYFSLVDGIIAMEGNGPVSGKKKMAGVLVGGYNPVAVDIVCATLMGFDYRKIPMIAKALPTHKYPLILGDASSIRPVSNVEEWNRPIKEWERASTLSFEAHFGWTNMIELEN